MCNISIRNISSPLSHLNIFVLLSIMSGEKEIKHSHNISSTYNIDILNLDTAIRKQFAENAKNIGEYKKHLEELEMIRMKGADNTPLTSYIQKLQKQIDSLEKNEDLNFYISDSNFYIHEYRNLLNKPIKLTFGGRSNTAPPPSPITEEKQNIIDSYLRVAKKYFDVDKWVAKNCALNENVTAIPNNTPICSTCSNIDNFEYVEQTIICSECGSEMENVKLFSSSYRDSDRANMNTRYTYDRRVHFRDCINQYQGKQNCTIDKKVYDDLEQQFRNHHLLREEASASSLSPSSRKKYKFSNIKKSHILMFLKQLRYSKHYENVNLIHYNLTGIKPDDIGYLEEQLMKDFDLLISVYDKKFKHKIKRTNFISTHFVLYQLLHRHNHPCRKEDFVMLKTNDRKNFHNDICREIFMEIGWNFDASS